MDPYADGRRRFSCGAGQLIKRGAFSSLLRNESGIAAVEFALILPLMLVIFMGLVELSRSMRASQKVDLVAHTLADLTAQQLNGGQAVGQAGLTEADITSIFSAANTLMAPLQTANLKMTISEISISSPQPNQWQAKATWTVARNGGQQRPCETLSPMDAKPVSIATIPKSYVEVTNGVTPTPGHMIVADIIYEYNPGVHFEFFKWNSPVSISLQRTSYAPVRNTFQPSHIQYFMNSGKNCGNAP